MSYLVYLYNEIPKDALDLNRVAVYLGKQRPSIQIEVRGSFIAHFVSSKLITGLAAAWNSELSEERGAGLTPAQRLDYERRAHLDPREISPQVIYNGFELQELLQEQIPRSETSSRQLHLILTPRLPVTKGEAEGRHHARTALCGQPSLVSSSGLVEAPARPAEYYLLRHLYQNLGQEMPEAEVSARFGGQFLTYHDPRLTDVILGYLLQAITYYFFGEGFCSDPRCRLYNAHRQQEMLAAQLEPPEFCSRHQLLFNQKLL